MWPHCYNRPAPPPPTTTPPFSHSRLLFIRPTVQLQHHDCGLPIRKRRGKWNPTCRCLFSALGDPLVCNILAFLPPVERAASSLISSRWNHVVNAYPSLWHHAAYEEEADCGGSAVDVLRVYALPQYGRKVKVRGAHHITVALVPSLQCL